MSTVTINRDHRVDVTITPEPDPTPTPATDDAGTPQDAQAPEAYPAPHPVPRKSSSKRTRPTSTP